MYRYDIRRHVQNQNKDLSMRKKVFENLTPNFTTHDFGCVANLTSKASTHVAYKRSEQFNQVNSKDIHALKHIFRKTQF